jgi:hypothetical protein
LVSFRFVSFVLFFLYLLFSFDRLHRFATFRQRVPRQVRTDGWEDVVTVCCCEFIHLLI